MDRATASELAHGDLALHNPLSLGRLDEVIALLDLPPHARVLDVGCGAGEALARVCERWDAAGTGVDAHEPLVTRARRRAPELDFHAADARTFPYDRGGYDVAMTIGSSHAFGGDFRYALGRLAELARPGGQVLLGEGYWRRPPDAAYLAELGAEADELANYAGLVRCAMEVGLVPLYATVASESEWDRYEWRLVLNGERHAARHPDDPGMDELLTWVRAGRDRYLAPGGRDTLGFGLFLFARPR